MLSEQDILVFLHHACCEEAHAREQNICSPATSLTSWEGLPTPMATQSTLQLLNHVGPPLPPPERPKGNVFVLS